MALSMLLAAALSAQAEPPAQSGPRPSFIICPGNPRCPRTPRGQDPGQAAPPDQPARAFAIARPDPGPATGRLVYFAVGSAALDDQARAVLEAVADWLAANPQLAVNIEGHADARGSREANLALASRRAEAVRDFLVARGIAAGRLTAISYGEERPALYDEGESVWMMNRRVEIRVR
jgi:peptidoglycan-associated lipoprotein